MPRKSEEIAPLTIVQDEQRGPEVIAKAIEDVADSAKKLLASRLTRRAIVLLIHDSLTGLGKPNRRDIENVLEAAAGLRKYVVK